MMTQQKLHIGEGLLLPKDVVTATTVVYGGKGMGKTNFGSVLVEELTKVSQRWAVLDPMGVWWGLRHSKDGKGAGIPCLILGGPHGDIPIEPTGGAVVADLVADEDVNVIIDFSRKANGEAWGVGEKIRFVTDYGKRVFQRQSSLVNGRRREPLLQIMDEAARFIPQMIRAGQPELAMCLSVWSQIVEEGRNSGLGVVLLTQRSARLNKDVAELADAMIAFRTVGPNSIEAVTDWLGEHVPKAHINEIVEKLRSLPRGTALVVSPGWLQLEAVLAVRERETFDSSATPKPGESARRVTGKGATPDLGKYAERMKETIEKAKADDPKELRRTIAELQKQLTQRPTQPKVSGQTKTQAADPRVIERAVAAAVRKATEPLQRQLVWFQKQARQAIENFTKAVAPLNAIASATLPEMMPSKVVPPVDAPKLATPPARALTRPAASAPVDVTANGDRPLGDLHRQVAGILAAYHPKPVSIDLLAAMCGRTPGGSFSARLSEVRGAGLLVDAGRGQLIATDKCVQEYLGSFTPPSTTEEVLQLWDRKLGPLHKQVLDELIKHNGDPVAIDDLAAAVGRTPGGSFSARLSEIRSKNLLVDPRRGYVAANKEALFLEAS
jgi:uncharacterized protein